MAAATPIPMPQDDHVPTNFRAQDYPSEVNIIWDQAAMRLNPVNHINVSKEAFIGNIGINTLIELNLSGTIRNLPTSPVTMYLKSTNVNDKYPVNVKYLNANMEYVDAIFILNGTTPVELPLMYRVLDMENASSTSINAYLTSLGITGYVMGSTQGDITIYETGSTGLPTDAKTFAYYPASFPVNPGIKIERIFDASYTIPKNYTGYAFGFEAILGKNDEVFLDIQTRAPGGQWVSRIPVQMYENILNRTIRPRAIPELYDLRLLAYETSGTGNTPLSFSYQLILLRNSGE